jgi:hypothetical protein
MAFFFQPTLSVKKSDFGSASAADYTSSGARSCVSERDFLQGDHRSFGLTSGQLQIFV